MTITEENATKARGMFLNEFAILERSIEVLIATIFMGANNNRIWEMIELLLDRITFENKRTCLRTMLEKIDIQKGFIKTNTKGYPSNKICNEIRRLNDHRIYFAHYMLYENKERYSEKNALIGLFELRDKTNIKWYTLEEFTQLIVDMKKIITDLIVYFPT